MRAAVQPPAGDEMSERVGHSVRWGPVTTHHVRERRAFRPFLRVRAWIIIAAAFLVASVVLGLIVGASAGGPAFLGFLVASYVLWRSTYKWRVWNEAMAAQKARAAEADADERDRELFRHWLRQQGHQDGP
jgi:hypothetical protein